MTYDNTNRWTLNKNDRKEADNHPDYKGKANIEGVDYWLDGWIKDGANGKFISGTLKLRDQQGNGGMSRTVQNAAGDTDLDDDVPFATCDEALERRVR